MLAGVIVMFAAIKATAQPRDESRVKILRTPEAGVLKLVYAIDSKETLTVRFITNDGEVTTDRIKGSYPKGFFKRYDVKQLFNNSFRIELSSPAMTLVYRIVPSNDRKTFTYHLEKSIQNHALVAKK